MMALLTVFAVIISAIVLRQLPTVQDVAGSTLVVLGVALHGKTPHQESNERT
jgi:drug/metabolite transporter (DMT)-like permease